jgi:hypothetical protein
MNITYQIHTSTEDISSSDTYTESLPLSGDTYNQPSFKSLSLKHNDQRVFVNGWEFINNNQGLSGYILADQAVNNSDDPFCFISENIINDYLGMLSSGKVFEKVKDYESKYGLLSEEYLKKWEKGEVVPSEDERSWMRYYRSLEQGQFKYGSYSCKKDKTDYQGGLQGFYRKSYPH